MGGAGCGGRGEARRGVPLAAARGLTRKRRPPTPVPAPPHPASQASQAGRAPGAPQAGPMSRSSANTAGVLPLRPPPPEPASASGACARPVVRGALEQLGEELVGWGAQHWGWKRAGAHRPPRRPPDRPPAPDPSHDTCPVDEQMLAATRGARATPAHGAAPLPRPPTADVAARLQAAQADLARRCADFFFVYVVGRDRVGGERPAARGSRTCRARR